MIFGHNHPSGNPEPSAADRAVTARLKQALALVEVRVLDHFVVGDGAADLDGPARLGLRPGPTGQQPPARMRHTAAGSPVARRARVLLGYARLVPTRRHRTGAAGRRRRARACWRRAGPDIVASAWARSPPASALDPRALDAALLGTARLGLRHGSFGDDFHAYHNETHVLEVGERRLLRMLEGMGEHGAARPTTSPRC